MGVTEFEIVNLRRMSEVLDEIRRTAPKSVGAAGIRGALKVGRRAVKAAINSSDASAEMKKAARKAVGYRFIKGGWAGAPVAKVGFGVGKQTGKKTGGGSSGGDGISKANIQWAVMGTEEREQDTGPQREVGAMPALFEGLVATALSGAKAAMIAGAQVAMSKKLKQIAERAAARGR